LKCYFFILVKRWEENYPVKRYFSILISVGKYNSSTVNITPPKYEVKR